MITGGIFRALVHFFFVLLSSIKKLFGNVNAEILKKSETVLRGLEHRVGLSQRVQIGEIEI